MDGAFSMLYIDNIVGTGYSYSESGSYTITQDGYGEELYAFIEQFYLMFSEYLHRELYIGGQSYAGKYVPAFGQKVHTRILANGSVILLKGIYVGGPFFDTLVQGDEYCGYYYAMGAISHSQLVSCKNNISELGDLVKCGNLDNLTLAEIFQKTIPRVLLRGRSNYATAELHDYYNIERLMTSDEFREVLHVSAIRYAVLNVEVYDKFKLDFFDSTKSKLAELLNNYKVLLYTGDLDGIITSPMLEAGLMTTPWSLQEQHNNSKRLIWKVGDRLKGFYTKIGQFCRVVVHGAGHAAPYDQPEYTLDMMTQFIQHGCILENL